MDEINRRSIVRQGLSNQSPNQRFTEWAIP